MAQSPCELFASSVPVVAQLKQEACSASGNVRTAVIAKFTAECIQAIRSAHHHRMPIKLKVDAPSQSGAIEIGSGDRVSKFRFALQQLPTCNQADLIAHDRARGYRSVATLQTKLQVHATEKALAETRAQKMAEEDRKKANKDPNKQKQRDQRLVTVKRATNQVAIGAQRPSPSSSNFSKPHLPDSSKLGGAKPSIGAHTGSSSSASAGARSIVQAEISRKPLRKRIVHLIVLGRFHTAEEILTQLRKDSINGNEDDVNKARDIIDEVSETGKDTTGRLHLRQSFYNEIDPRWPGFSSAEKASVRKILSGNTGNSSNFAPTRKSGMAPPQAPSASHTNNVSPEAIPMPPTSSSQQRPPFAPPAGRKTPVKVPLSSAPPPNGKISPAAASNGNTNTCTSTPLDDLLPSASVVKRKAHAPVAATPEKRARQQSLSPPEDPSSANPAVSSTHQNVQKNATRTERPVQSNEEPANRPPPVASTQRRTTRDWFKEFPEAKSLADAQKYFDLFEADFPTYRNCYDYLMTIANEFNELRKQLDEATKNNREPEKIERMVTTRYAHYLRDADFVRKKHMHEELRDKLDVLKQRIASWENLHGESSAAKTDTGAQSRIGVA